MNSDESSRGMYNQPNRKPTQSKNHMYSPSSNYNYGNSNYNGNSNSGYNGQHQHPRRRTDRYKRESLNYTERIVKQNDAIIRILKEIRDRLPAPEGAEHRHEYDDQAAVRNSLAEVVEQISGHDDDEEVVMEPLRRHREDDLEEDSYSDGNR